MRTYYQDFKRDNGAAVTVEYTFNGGSETIYSPRFGADGGDACEVSIVKAFDHAGDVKLTDAEDERFCEWLCEHHVDDYDDDFLELP